LFFPLKASFSLPSFPLFISLLFGCIYAFSVMLPLVPPFQDLADCHCTSSAPPSFPGFSFLAWPQTFRFCARGHEFVVFFVFHFCPQLPPRPPNVWLFPLFLFCHPLLSDFHFGPFRPLKTGLNDVAYPPSPYLPLRERPPYATRMCEGRPFGSKEERTSLTLLVTFSPPRLKVSLFPTLVFFFFVHTPFA